MVLLSDYPDTGIETVWNVTSWQESKAIRPGRKHTVSLCLRAISGKLRFLAEGQKYCVVNKILARRQRATRILRPFVTNRLRKYEWFALRVGLDAEFL